MFRKPKRKANKETLRRKENGVDEDDNMQGGSHDQDNQQDAVGTAAADSHEPGNGKSGEDEDDRDATTSALLNEARKRFKKTPGGSTAAATNSNPASTTAILHSFPTTSNATAAAEAQRNLVTSVAKHLPENHNVAAATAGKAERGADGIFRDLTRNAFHAGPVRAPTNIRVTARFDYQPDICKDYKDTGFCGYGDTCIYLHDRGDTLTGWQLEEQWQTQQRLQKEKQQAELDLYLDDDKQAAASITTADDNLPFACFLCRNHFQEPVVTTCGHYFCQACILKHVQQQAQSGGGAAKTTTTTTKEAGCPICGKDTHAVFHEPTKLIAKKKKVLGVTASKAADSWEQFYRAFSK